MLLTQIAEVDVDISDKDPISKKETKQYGLKLSISFMPELISGQKLTAIYQLFIGIDLVLYIVNEWL